VRIQVVHTTHSCVPILATHMSLLITTPSGQLSKAQKGKYQIQRWKAVRHWLHACSKHFNGENHGGKEYFMHAWSQRFVPKCMVYSCVFTVQYRWNSKQHASCSRCHALQTCLCEKLENALQSCPEEA